MRTQNLTFGLLLVAIFTSCAGNPKSDLEEKALAQAAKDSIYLYNNIDYSFVVQNDTALQTLKVAHLKDDKWVLEASIFNKRTKKTIRVIGSESFYAPDDILVEVEDGTSSSGYGCLIENDGIMYDISLFLDNGLCRATVTAMNRYGPYIEYSIPEFMKPDPQFTRTQSGH